MLHIEEFTGPWEGTFSCLFTWKEAWKQMDRPELRSIQGGAVPHSPVLAAEQQENTRTG